MNRSKVHENVIITYKKQPRAFKKFVNIFFIVLESPDVQIVGCLLLRCCSATTSKSTTEVKILGSSCTGICLLVSSPVRITVLVLVCGPCLGGPGPGLVSGLLLPLEGGWHNLRGEVEVITEVLDTLVGQGVVVVPPGELLLQVSLRDKGLAGIHDMQVGYINLSMFWCVWILLANQHSLLEEVFKDELSVVFGHKHGE